MLTNGELSIEKSCVLFLQLFCKNEISRNKVKHILTNTKKKIDNPLPKKKKIYGFNNHHSCCCCHPHPLKKILDRKEICQNINIGKCLWVRVSQSVFLANNFLRDSENKTKKLNKHFGKMIYYILKDTVQVCSVLHFTNLSTSPLRSTQAEDSTLGNTAVDDGI